MDLQPQTGSAELLAEPPAASRGCLKHPERLWVPSREAEMLTEAAQELLAVRGAFFFTTTKRCGGSCRATLDITVPAGTQGYQHRAHRCVQTHPHPHQRALCISPAFPPSL